MLRKPGPQDIPDFQKKYIELCPVYILPFLEKQKDQFISLIDNLEPDHLNYRYAPEKWSLRELIMHVIDTEQIFNYRALAIQRGEQQILPGFDQDKYISFSNFDHIDKSDLISLFTAVRQYSLIFYKNIHNDEWNLKGYISNYKMSLLAMPYMIGGHLEYHLNIIRERYLS